MTAYRRNRIGGLAAAIAVAAGVAACTGGDATADSAALPVTVGTENVAIATSEEIASGPSLSGTLTAERAAMVRAQVAATVLQTYVEEGQVVRAGTLLAQLDAAAISDAHLSARSGVTVAQNSVDNAARELARAERLQAAGAIAERDVEQARLALSSARAGLADAQARLAAAGKQLSNTSVRSPFAGIVAFKRVSAGDVVQPGTELFVVVDPSSMRLDAAVPADQLAELRVGLPVSFTVSGYTGRRFAGHVTRINPVADPATRQVRISVAIPNTAGTLVGGLHATGRVASTRTGITVPFAAVDESGPAPTVLRISDGRVERVAVTLGVRDETGERVEVLAGLLAGDTVLTGAARAVTPGTFVRVAAGSGAIARARAVAGAGGADAEGSRP